MKFIQGVNMSVTIDEAPFLDMFDPEVQADPAGAVEQLRRQSWLARTQLGVLVLGRPQVQAMLPDRRLRSALPEVLAFQGVADRRQQPRDDMITTLVQAREADDRLSDDEVQGMIAALLFAGHDTTRNQLGLAMWLFAEHPDQWELLRGDPSLAVSAVEEVLR